MNDKLSDVILTDPRRIYEAMINPNRNYSNFLKYIEDTRNNISFEDYLIIVEKVKILK